MESKVQLYWYCFHCGAHDPVEPTGGDEEYVLGDREKCISCGDGTAHVVGDHEKCITEEVCEKLQQINLRGVVKRTAHWDYVRVFILDPSGVTHGRICIHKGKYSHAKWYVDKIYSGRILPDEYYPMAWLLLLNHDLLLDKAEWSRVVREAIRLAEAKRDELQALRDANPNPKRKPLKLHVRRHLFDCAKEVACQNT